MQNDRNEKEKDPWWCSACTAGPFKAATGAQMHIATIFKCFHESAVPVQRKEPPPNLPAVVAQQIDGSSKDKQGTVLDGRVDQTMRNGGENVEFDTLEDGSHKSDVMDVDDDITVKIIDEVDLSSSSSEGCNASSSSQKRKFDNKQSQETRTKRTKLDESTMTKIAPSGGLACFDGVQFQKPISPDATNSRDIAEMGFSMPSVDTIERYLCGDMNSIADGGDSVCSKSTDTSLGAASTSILTTNMERYSLTSDQAESKSAVLVSSRSAVDKEKKERAARSRKEVTKDGQMSLFQRALRLHFFRFNIAIPQVANGKYHEKTLEVMGKLLFKHSKFQQAEAKRLEAFASAPDDLEEKQAHMEKARQNWWNSVQNKTKRVNTGLRNIRSYIETRAWKFFICTLC